MYLYSVLSLYSTTFYAFVFAYDTQGIDLKAGGKSKKTKRTAPKSNDIYLKLLVKVSLSSILPCDVYHEYGSLDLMCVFSFFTTMMINVNPSSL